MRRKHSAKFKAMVALEAIKGMGSVFKRKSKFRKSKRWNQITYYNRSCLHQSLRYRTSDEIYYERVEKQTKKQYLLV